MHLNKIILDAEHIGTQGWMLEFSVCFTARLLDWFAMLEFKNPSYDDENVMRWICWMKRSIWIKQQRSSKK